MGYGLVHYTIPATTTVNLKIGIHVAFLEAVAATSYGCTHPTTMDVRCRAASKSVLYAIAKYQHVYTYMALVRLSMHVSYCLSASGV